MTNLRPVPAALRVDCCLARQARLLDRIERRGLDAALILDRRHVHYLTGYWARSVFQPALLLRVDERPRLAVPYEVTLETADANTYQAAPNGTLVDVPLDVAVESLGLTPDGRVGCDVPAAQVGGVVIADELIAMRRQKWPDEVEMLRRGCEVAAAGFAYARGAVAPGVTEVELFAGVQRAMTIAAGEPIGELGNDFQSGAPGGPPRDRPMRAGELLPLDLGVPLRGYTADLCRTIAVGGAPSAEQRDAHARVLEVLDAFENRARAGASCRELHAWSRGQLHGFGGATFTHHLGHGVGLSPHEAPRLNDHWDDVLRPGDVITAEPGLYSPDLLSGVRVEQMYLVTDAGLDRLSNGISTGLTE